MKLNLNERITLLSILPNEGNIITIKIIRDLKQYIGIQDDEFDYYNIKEVNNTIMWDIEKGLEEKDFVFKNKTKQIISNALLLLNTQKKLQNKHISLYDKFIGEEDE